MQRYFMFIGDVSVFTKLINEQQQHHLQISYTEFHIYQAINVDCTDRNIFTLPT
jgi:hypothetical protein